MLQLRDTHKKKIAGLTEYKNLYIESELQSGDKTLCFSYPKKAKYHSDIVEECYINTKENEYIVKEKNIGSEYTSFKCILNLEELEGQPFERYASEEQTIDKALALALAGTDWIVGKCNLKKRRTVRISNCSSLDIIKEIKKIYRCDLVFNTLTKTIDLYKSLGEDKGAYFIDSLNLKDLSIQGNSYDYYTRIIPIGKDNLRISSINNGKDYVENFQYSNKIKTFYWKDERYTVIENLKEDAEAKLNEISKPYRSYSAEIINLAKLNDKYKNILDYKLGDTITLISKENKFRDKQRIVKIIEHPDEHELDTVELANTTLSFEETQTQFQEAADTVDNITTDNGTIDGSTVDNIETKQISDFEANVIKVTNLTAVNAKIHNLEAQNVNITGKLTAVEATIGTLNSNLATIDKLTVTHTASINELQAKKASITQLQATNATIQVLEANVGKIETLVNGNLSSENLQAGSITARELAANSITAGSTVIGEGAIGNAQISNLDATKLNAGTIDTSLITIAGPNSNLKLQGNRLQVFVGIGSNQIERVSLGDIFGDGSKYGFLVRGADGKTVIMDENGVKSEGITNGSITNDKINSNANIDGSKLNINSVVTKINGATTSILGTKIDINGINLSLKLSQQDTTITEHKKTIDSHTTSIEANTNAIKLKVDNQTYITDKTNFNNTLNKATSDISLLQGQISLKVEQSDITNAIDNIEIGSANLVNNSAILQNLFSQINTYKGNRTVIDDNLALSNKCVKFECTNGGTGFHMPLFPKTTEKIGNVYTWSFWAKCSVVKSGNVGHESGGQKNITITTEWKRFEYTWKFTDSQYSSFTFYQGWNSGEILYIRDFQIVKGNKAGDWTPSITDIQNDIDTKVSTAKAEIKVTTDAIYQNISNLTTTVNAKADGSIVTSLNNKVSSLETGLNGIKGEVSSLETTTTTINNKVNQAQSDADINKNNILNLTIEVTTVKSNVATLDVNLKGITQRVSSTESTTVSLTNQVNKAQNDANTANNKIDSLDIGGRNLARKTSKDFKEYKAFTGIDNVCPELAKVCLLDLKAGDDIYITLDYEWEDIVAMSGRTPKAWTQGSGDVTSWNAGSFPSSAGIYTMKFGVGSGSDKVQYKVTLNAEHVKNSFWTAQVRHDGVQSGIVRWKNFKVEKGNKPTDWSPAPEDIDSAINSIDNKVTITNSKVASIETNLNSIISRVSKVETTTSNINGQVNNLYTRMNSAEIKLTDSSIINTVSSQFYKKGECDSKYTTQTEFKQTTSNWEFRVTQTGKVNELENSDFGKPDYIWVEEGNTDKVWYEVANWYGGGVPFTTAIRFTDCTNTSAYIRQSFKPKNPKMKTFSVSGYSHYFDVRNTGGDGYPMCHWYVEVRYENNQASYHNFDVREHSGNDAWSWLHWVVNTEVATKGMITKINFYAYKRNTTGDWRTSQLYFHEGDEKLAWRPGGEIYSDTVAIDSKGVTAYHNNGSYSQIGSRGLEHWENGMCKPYHYITDVKIVDARGKCDGTWFTVYLGDYFKGKQCDLAWQMGNIALTYGRCLSGYEVNCRNYNWQAGTVEMSVKVFYKSEWAGGAGYDKDAYAWGKIFIWY